MLYCSSTSFWQAVGKRLVDFFGGSVDFNDCDDIDVDYSKEPGSTDVNAPTSGEHWENFQKRILEVPRIHKDELHGDDCYTYEFDDDGLIIQ